MTSNAGFQSLAAASGLDIRGEDLAEAITRRNPEAPRAKVEQVIGIIGLAAEMAGVFTRLSSARREMPVGTGLGERIGLEEGARRLASFAAPVSLEAWAGPVARPTEIAGKLGIARSTLDEWRRAGVAIGLLAGARKHVFPLAQFADGRPVAGLAELVTIIGDPRSAWLWLVEPAPDGGTRLEELRRGELAKVLEAAREDFA